MWEMLVLAVIVALVAYDMVSLWLRTRQIQKDDAFLDRMATWSPYRERTR